MKKTNLLLFLLLPLLIISPSFKIVSVAETEQKLTDGNIKSWIFYKAERTLGKINLPASLCKYQKLTYKQNGKTYFGVKCGGSNENSTWKIEEIGIEEYTLKMNEEYIIDIYSKNGKEILRLRTLAKSKGEETTDYLYYAE